MKTNATISTIAEEALINVTLAVADSVSTATHLCDVVVAAVKALRPMFPDTKKGSADNKVIREAVKAAAQDGLLENDKLPKQSHGKIMVNVNAYLSTYAGVFVRDTRSDKGTVKAVVENDPSTWSAAVFAKWMKLAAKRQQLGKGDFYAMVGDEMDC